LASITQYRGNTWRATITKRGYKRLTKTFARKTDAMRWATKIESEMDTGTRRDVSREAQKVRVRQLFEDYIEKPPSHLKNPEQTLYKLRFYLRDCPFMERFLDQITPQDIQKYRDARLKIVSKATVTRDMSALSGVFTYAIKEWHVPLLINPVRQVAKPAHADRRRERRWQQSEIDAVLCVANFDESVKPVLYRDYVGWAIVLGIETGMRRAEFHLPRKRDFHPEERYVFLSDTKNGDRRKVPLSARALSLFTTLTDGLEPNDLIFPMSKYTLSKYVKDALINAGLGEADLHFHDTRHEAATRLSKKLSNVLELSAMTGHRSLQSLKRYYNPSPAEIASKIG
jgi:integrase